MPRKLVAAVALAHLLHGLKTKESTLLEELHNLFRQGCDACFKRRPKRLAAGLHNGLIDSALAALFGIRALQFAVFDVGKWVGWFFVCHTVLECLACRGA